MGEIGNQSEPMINYTLNLISNGNRMSYQVDAKQFNHFTDSKALEPLRNEMYVDFIPK